MIDLFTILMSPSLHSAPTEPGRALHLVAAANWGLVAVCYETSLHIYDRLHQHLLLSKPPAKSEFVGC